MAHAEAAAFIAVEVHVSPAPRVVDIARLQLPAGATVADALQASGLLARHGLTIGEGPGGEGPGGEGLSVGVWGRPCTLGSALREADRVEVYRGLLVDPKEARRQRYRKQPPRQRRVPVKRAAG